MDNPEKPGTQEEEKQNTTECVLELELGNYYF